MTKKKTILLIAVISIMLCACSDSKDTSTSEPEEFTHVTESTEVINVESTIQNLEANASQAVSVSSETTEDTTTFKYDSVNHTITIDGVLYTIATDAMNYSGSYMSYWSTYHNMEDIVDCINNNDLLVKGWRDGFSADT